MKKKKWILLILMVLVLALLIPIPMHIKDGGTVEYTAILYKVAKVHRLVEPTGYEDGLTIEILGKEVYNNVEKTSSSEELPTTGVVLQNLKGEKVALSSFNGKPMVLSFWATWCEPCKEELPDLEELYQKYGRDVHFVTVNMITWQEQQQEEITQFMQEHSYHFPVYLDVERNAEEFYHVRSIPQIFLFDENGNRTERYSTRPEKETLETAIQELLRK